jgi:hypothetical protein
MCKQTNSFQFTNGSMYGISIDHVLLKHPLIECNILNIVFSLPNSHRLSKEMIKA